MTGEGSWLGQMCQGADKGEAAGIVKSREPIEEQASEQRAENLDRQEEGRARGDPARSVRQEAAARHDHVDVRMVGHGRAPGVEHGGEADAGTQMPRIGGDPRHRLCCRPEQEAVDGGFVLEGERRDLGRQRKDNMEVADR